MNLTRTAVSTTESKIIAQSVDKPRHTWEQGPRKIGPRDGKFVDILSNGIRYMAWDQETSGLFSVVEHPIPPKHVVAPLHKHTYEDEYSFIIEGRVGAILGDDVVYAEAGDFVFKPRNQWHTFWNDGDTMARVLEIIAPGGFEHFFEDIRDLMTSMNASNVQDILGPGKPGTELALKYGLEFKPESLDAICKTYGLVYPGHDIFGTVKK
jgi:mannose-6-phosphate isomerase-like protein (cupin superfamily)